jgi:hypothetical protein
MPFVLFNFTYQQNTDLSRFALEVLHNLSLWKSQSIVFPHHRLQKLGMKGPGEIAENSRFFRWIETPRSFNNDKRSNPVLDLYAPVLSHGEISITGMIYFNFSTLRLFWGNCNCDGSAARFI